MSSGRAGGRRRRRPFKVLDRLRTVKKGLMAENLEELVRSAKEKLSYLVDQDVVVVLEEDGTEVDEDDYFQTLEDNTELMVLYRGDRWSPFVSQDVTDNGDSQESSQQLISILLRCGGHQPSIFSLSVLCFRLEADPGTIALLTEAELELVSEIDEYADTSNFPRYDQKFLEHLKKAAEKHLVEKGQIRDTLALLKIYHKANENQKVKRESVKNEDVESSSESSRKKHKADK